MIMGFTIFCRQFSCLNLGIFNMLIKIGGARVCILMKLHKSQIDNNKFQVY